LFFHKHRFTIVNVKVFFIFSVAKSLIFRINSCICSWYSK